MVYLHVDGLCFPIIIPYAYPQMFWQCLIWVLKIFVRKRQANDLYIYIMHQLDICIMLKYNVDGRG